MSRVYIRVENTRGESVAIREDTISSMVETKGAKIINPGFPDEEIVVTEIKYGGFGQQKQDTVFAKTTIEEILRQINGPPEVEINPDETYTGLATICGMLEAHSLNKLEAITLIQRFIEERLVEIREEYENEDQEAKFDQRERE